MNKKEYLAMRTQLLNEAQKLIDEGKTEEAQEKMNEVTTLDSSFDAIAKAQANMNALSNNQPIMLNLEDNFGDEKMNLTDQEKVLDAWASKDYLNAWYKTIVDKQLTKNEQNVYTLVNEAYTHTTQNTGVVIPKSVSRGIWEEAGNMYPYFDDVAKSYVSGNFSMVQEDTSTDATWYDESTVTEDGKEEFKEFALSGCELSRVVTISWKLKEMAMEDFIPYIQRKMAKKMGAGAGYGAVRGAGKKNEGKPEPTGVITAVLAEEGKPQVVEYADKITYNDITNARSKVKSGYGNGLKVYANNTTIWQQLANIVDANKRPIFMVDPLTGGFKILGCEVKEDASFADGDVLFSNAAAGYHMNISKEMSMLPEEHVKERKTDYCGYAIMDGNATTTKAHALITKAGE